MTHSPRDACILLFSGGRDSTIAAVRLASAFDRLVLATITSDHLIGISAVEQRLSELRPHLGEGAEWRHVLQPRDLPADPAPNQPTCLPCHHAYVATGISLARGLGAVDVALGYASYQSSWPEQSPYAVDRLRCVLGDHGMRLHLPAWELGSKDAAMAELTRLGLSPAALEQKCLQQQFNIALPPVALRRAIDRWEDGLRQTLSRPDPIALDVVRSHPLRGSLVRS